MPLYCVLPLFTGGFSLPHRVQSPVLSEMGKLCLLVTILSCFESRGRAHLLGASASIYGIVGMYGVVVVKN